MKLSCHPRNGRHGLHWLSIDDDPFGRHCGANYRKDDDEDISKTDDVEKTDEVEKKDKTIKKKKQKKKKSKKSDK